MTNQDTIEEALKSEASLENLVTQITKDLTTRNYDISHLVELLGFALTSKSVDSRVKGTQLLSDVLSQLPKDFLNETQLEYLSIFYADRLKDHHNVIPTVINGINALIRMKNLPKSCISTMLQSFFQHTSCQSQVRSDRLKLFQIFKYLTEEYAEALKSMSADFIFGLINSIDGERDPRNLDFIFSFMPNVISTFPLLHLNEEMFETFACYFPVDFNPSSGDPDTITREILASNLKKCLVASPEFVEWTVALALEKLETNLVVSKLDSLDLLQAAALSFQPKVLEPYFEQIWKELKTELLPGSDNTILTAALTTLRTILERAASVNEISHNYQTIVLGTILNHLNDVSQRLFQPATAIALVCIAGDADFAAGKILGALKIKLTGTPPLNDEERIKVYTIIAQAYKLASLKNAQLKSLDDETSDGIQKDITTSLRRDLNGNDDDDEGTIKINEQSIDLKRAALSVLNECAPIISETNRVLIYKALVQLITDKEIDLEFTQLLQQLGALYPIELQSNIVDVCIRNFEIFNNFIKAKILRNLIGLVHQMAFSERVLNLIFENIFQTNKSNDVREITLVALTNLLRDDSDQKFIVELQQQSCLIDKLIKLAQSGIYPLSLLERISSVLSTIIQQLSLAEQYTIATEYLSQLNLQLSSDLYIARGLLAFLHKDISLNDHFEILLNDLIKLSLESNDEKLREVAHHLICSMVNKIEHNEQNQNILMKVIAKLKDEIQHENSKAVAPLSWIAKGLIVRGYEDVGEIIQTLADLLNHPTLKNAAILAFDIISTEYPELHLPVVKYLFKQKYFHMIINKFGHKLETFCEQHINAFIYVLKTTPHKVLKMNIEKLGPILFKSLESQKTETLCISLKICEHFVKEQDEYFRSHLNHIIPSCLELSKFKASMSVRIAALNLLHDIASYPTFILLPHKVDVVLDLAIPLDDSKRLVRNAAVIARNTWCLVGNTSPSDE